MKQSLELVSFCTLLFFIPGCGRLIDFAYTTFDQGQNRALVVDRARSNIRSATIYDQFTTAGMFDALWLSDSVRTDFSAMYSSRRGYDQTQHKVFLRRQLEENKHYVSFYVLSSFDKPLALDADWQLFLHVNENSYTPVQITQLELEPEYKEIFGKLLTRFKDAYLVRFNLYDINERKIISGAQTLQLYLRSLEKQIVFTWDVVYTVN